MNAEVFRSVFKPVGPNHPLAGTIRDGRYLWRWDWHLRNFLYAMIPPACAYGYVCAIEWYTADLQEDFRKSVLEKKKRATEPLDSVRAQTTTLEERVAAMERHLLALRDERERALGRAIVLEAKSAIKSYRQAIRASPSSSTS